MQIDHILDIQYMYINYFFHDLHLKPSKCQVAVQMNALEMY